MANNIILNENQQRSLIQMMDFVESSSDRVFILKGYAGTGKTTLMRFLIKKLADKDISYRLLSTTGRAAKILSNYTDEQAGTIHSLIYSYKDFNKDVSKIENNMQIIDEIGQLYLVFEPAVISADDGCTIYIVDESSMISDIETKHIVQAQFGSGRLLKELLDYDTRPNSKFIFIGDPCQLPPFTGTFSPALDKNYISRTFNCGVQEASLTQVMRQSDGNTIVDAATQIRSLWHRAPEQAEAYANNKVWGFLPIRRYPDIHLTRNSDDMLKNYVENIKQHDYNDSIIICKSNATCHKLSLMIRQQLGLSGSIAKNDLLLVVQNQLNTGLMNGDMLKVIDIAPDSERTFHPISTGNYRTELIFREVKVQELFTQKVYTTLLMENTVTMQQSNLDSRQQTGLFVDFILRMKEKGIDRDKNKSLFNQMMHEDPYLNALRCSYGYAITCHKAQGGEWNKVYIYPGARNITLNPTKSIYQWIYTSMTRGKQSVHLIDDFYIQ